jgi:thioredoxin 1
MMARMSISETLPRATVRQVYCLCAAWCVVCRDWRAQFDAQALAHPRDRFVWVDVDAQEAVLDILDIETFPVLLIAEGATPLFCGPIQPQAQVLSRLLAGLAQPAAGLTPQAQPLLDLLQAD